MQQNKSGRDISEVKTRQDGRQTKSNCEGSDRLDNSYTVNNFIQPIQTSNRDMIYIDIQTGCLS